MGKEGKKKNTPWFKKHVDTVVVLVWILFTTLLMNSKINDLEKQVEKQLSFISLEFVELKHEMKDEFLQLTEEVRYLQEESQSIYDKISELKDK